MSNLKFGGPLGAFVDPLTGREYPARVAGTAVFDRELEREMLAPARAALVDVTAKELRRMVVPGVNLLSFVQSPALESAVGAAASAALGRAVRIDGMIVAFSGADDHAVAAAVALPPAASPPAAAGPRLCPSCNAPAPGKFCASCGAAQNAAPNPPPNMVPQNMAPPNMAPPNMAPSTITPTLDPPFLAFPIGQAIAAGTRVVVPVNCCFVGFANGAIACNLQAGSHVLGSPCESGVFISLRGLPFELKLYVGARGYMAARGALYMQDPVVAFRFMQHIDASFFGVLEIVLGRVVERVASSVQDGRQLCYAVAQVYSGENEAVKGVTLHLESLRPLPE